MARGQKAKVDVSKVVDSLQNNGAEFAERKVTVAFCGVDSDGNPIYATPKKDGSYPKKYADKIQKSETRTVKIPKNFKVSDIPETDAVQMLREYLRNKLVLKTQADIKTVLAGPEKSILAIEETIKKMGLSGEIADTVRATLLAGLQQKSEAETAVQ